MIRRHNASAVRRTRRAPAIRRRSGNPLFGNRQPSRGPFDEVLKVLAIAGLPVIGLAVLAYLIWGPSLQAVNLEIIGASPETERSVRRIVEEQMAERRIFPADSTLFFDAERAAEEIGRSYFLESLEVERRLPDTIRIDITEKPLAGALLADGRFLALDGEGFVVRELTGDEIMSLQNLPEGYEEALAPELGAEAVVVADLAEGEGGAEAQNDILRFSPFPVLTLDYVSDESKIAGIGKQPVPAEVMALAVRAYAELDRTAGVRPVRFVSRGPDTESLEAVMAGGWRAHLSAGLPFDRQAERLDLVLRERVGARRAELEYVDLRFGERIYLKFVGSVASSESQ